MVKIHKCLKGQNTFKKLIYEHTERIYIGPQGLYRFAKTLVDTEAQLMSEKVPEKPLYVEPMGGRFMPMGMEDCDCAAQPTHPYNIRRNDK